MGQAPDTHLCHSHTALLRVVTIIARGGSVLDVGSLWGSRGTSPSPCYLALPNRQDGTVKALAVAASEAADFAH